MTVGYKKEEQDSFPNSRSYGCAKARLREGLDNANSPIYDRSSDGICGDGAAAGWIETPSGICD